MSKKLSFEEILDIPEARKLVELIEELLDETEAELVRIRNVYIDELKNKYGYTYIF